MDMVTRRESFNTAIVCQENQATDTERKASRSIRRIISANNRALDAFQEAEMAEEFNQYFINITREISDTIKNKNKIKLLRFSQSQVFGFADSFFFSPVTESEFKQLIEKLKKM